jgi:hypothetical protein
MNDKDEDKDKEGGLPAHLSRKQGAVEVDNRSDPRPTKKRGGVSPFQIGQQTIY